jgi:hypothetical protein
LRSEAAGKGDSHVETARADAPGRTAAGPARLAIVGFPLLTAAVLALASPAYPVDDVPGWQNTRWGMTMSEVRKSVESLGLPLAPLPAPYARALGADAPFKTSVEIAGGHYDAIFLFAEETQRLGRVLIRTVDFSRQHALALHDALLRALTERYGEPGETDSRGSVASLTRWTFKTTTVVLSRYTDMTVPGNPVTQVMVTYAPTAAAAQDPKDKLLGLGLLRALGEFGRGSR